MSIIIREMQPSDWQAVATIYQEGMDTNLATFQTECPTYEAWDAAHLRGCRLVAVSGGASIAGWAALSTVSSRRVYAGVAEISVYIKADQRGKGIGLLIMGALVSESEKNGIWTLQSGIMSNNLASIRLHERCGFRMIGTRERIGCDRDGVWRDTVLMERRSRYVGI